MLGALEYRKGRGEPMTLAVLQGFVHNEGTGWKFALDALSSFCERALAKLGKVGGLHKVGHGVWQSVSQQQAA